MVDNEYRGPFFSVTSSIATSARYGSIETTDEEGAQSWVVLKLPQFPEEMVSRDGKSVRTISDTADSTKDESWMEFSSPEEYDEDSRAKVFALFGFEYNPFASGSDIRNNKAADMRLAMLSNFSTAYNVVSISLALDIMQEIYPSTPNDKSLCSSALIAGMIVGQLVGGALGDVVGRHLAMTVVMMLQIIGAIATALSSNGDHISIFVIIAFWRFVLGIGCGGVYPLAATITAEASGSKEGSSKAVALAFSMQGVGYFVAPVLTAVAVTVLPQAHWLCWRILLGFGAIPGIFLMILRIKSQLAMQKNSSSGDMRDKMIMATARDIPISVFSAIRLEKDLLRKFLGTGGCWLLFDILFYGNILFQPVVLSAAFGSVETVQKVAIDTCVVSGLALPGYFVSVLLMGHQSARFIQGQGFLIMAILYAFIGLLFEQLAECKLLLIVLYGSTFFFSNYGPNATTYVLPSMTYSRSCRSTLNGVCAACGKVGALLGSMFFATATSIFGQQVVMLACAALSLLGLIVTLSCVSEEDGKAPDSDERVSHVPMRVVLSKPSLFDHYQSSS